MYSDTPGGACNLGASAGAYLLLDPLEEVAEGDRIAEVRLPHAGQLRGVLDRLQQRVIK